ncbi:MFS general substrate transporter [Phialemonium atrogriseum]|uniref:MFS general substrate transporter n=1 Tax=Phialemonium atrogriseum TaxID=1093897 RepID=A0AAJ0C340_9PEZI|nr:MFS general substrate transporter [Phialemonium atrogriseum]KAK1766731.1 MFS general substrate transporter [Phialemonium atrogriseum]
MSDRSRTTPPVAEAQLAEEPSKVATWGLLSAYGSYQSYYETTMLPDTPTDKIAWIGTIQGVLLIMGGIITGPIYDRGHVRELLVAGTLLTVLGVMMLSLATEYYQIMLAQGWCVGIGSGILYTPSIATVAATFGPRHRALAVSLATSGTAVGGILYPVIFVRLLPSLGFAWTTRVLGFVTLAGLLVALPIILPSATKARSTAAVAGKARMLFDLTALKEPIFSVFCFALFFMWVAYWVPFFLIPTFAEFALGASGPWAFHLLVITNAATLPGRLFAVFIIQRIGVSGGMLACAAASALVLYAWLAVHSMAGFEAWIVMLGVVMAPLAVFFPAIIPQMCPSREVIGARMGIGSAAAALGVILGAPLGSALVDLEKAEFWRMEVFIGTCMAVGAVLMTYVWWQLRRQLPK